MTQTLVLADDLYTDVLDGKKKCTVRAGKRDIALGLLTFESASEKLPKIDVDVHSVQYIRAGYIPDTVALKDGAKDGIELFNALHRFYPNLGPEDTVTVVEYNLW